MQSHARKPIIPDKGDNSGSRMSADVFDFRTRLRRPIPVDQYLAMLDTLKKYFVEARRQRGQAAFQQSEDILKEIRFCAMLNPKFREATRDELKDILDDVYAFVNYE